MEATGNAIAIYSASTGAKLYGPYSPASCFTPVSMPVTSSPIRRTIMTYANPGVVSWLEVDPGFDLRSQNRIVELKQSATTDGQHDAWVFGANNYLAEPTVLYTYVECLSNVTALTPGNGVAAKMSVSSNYPVSTTSYDTNDGAGSTASCPQTAILAGGGFSYKNYYLSIDYSATRIVSNAVSLHATSSGWEGRISPSRFTVQVPSTNQSLPPHTEQISLQVYVVRGVSEFLTGIKTIGTLIQCANSACE